MNYTVISKSGWEGDFWRVRKTFTDKAEADQYANEVEAGDVTLDGYNVQVKGHRKSLASLISQQHGDSVKFSDGTVAAYD